NLATSAPKPVVATRKSTDASVWCAEGSEGCCPKSGAQPTNKTEKPTSPRRFMAHLRSLPLLCPGRPVIVEDRSLIAHGKDIIRCHCAHAGQIVRRPARLRIPRRAIGRVEDRAAVSHRPQVGHHACGRERAPGTAQRGGGTAGPSR